MSAILGTHPVPAISRKRVLGAVIAGTATIFIWGAVSHLVLMKGAGFSQLPSEDRVIAELRRSISKDGLYFFPSPDFSGHATAEETRAWENKFRAGPTGMIVFHQGGSASLSPRKLMLQLLADGLTAGIAVYLALLLGVPGWQRVLTMALLGAFSALSLGIIYWNWYGFPTAFFVAQCVDMVVGWSLAGAVIAKLVPRSRMRPLAQPNAEHLGLDEKSLPTSR